MATEIVEAAGCCDFGLLELVATGGVCLSETEDTAERVAPKRWQKILVAIYAIGNVILGIFELVLEGLALNEVTSPIADLPNITTTPSPATSLRNSTYKIFLNETSSTTQMWQPEIEVDDGVGLLLWKTGYCILVCIILPLDLWLLPQTLAKTACWGSFPPNETRDPYCLCFNIDDNDIDHGANETCCTPGFCTHDNCCGRIFLKKVAIKLLILFESIVHVIISSGRFLFFTTSRTNLIFAYGEYTFASGFALLAIDGLSFQVKSIQLFYAIPCCSNRVCTKYTVFTILSYFVANAAVYSSGFNFLIYSGSFLSDLSSDTVFSIYGIAFPCFIIASAISNALHFYAVKRLLVRC